MEISTLLESFKLVENGAILEVTPTWTDPKMFAKPHTYAYRYTRRAPDYQAEELYYNAQDNDRARFLLDSRKPVVSRQK